MNELDVLCIVIGVAITIVNILKGKWAVAFLGGIFVIPGALRVAKPGSWWDRHRSTPEQRERALRRYE
jgi:hypothetical protein